jgi:hypothetical protein
MASYGRFEPLALSEHQRVVLTVSDATSPRLRSDDEYLAAVLEQVAKEGPPPGLDEVRRLAKIPGSMTADFIAERENR